MTLRAGTCSVRQRPRWLPRHFQTCGLSTVNQRPPEHHSSKQTPALLPGRRSNGWASVSAGDALPLITAAQNQPFFCGGGAGGGGAGLGAGGDAAGNDGAAGASAGLALPLPLPLPFLVTVSLTLRTAEVMLLRTSLMLVLVRPIYAGGCNRISTTASKRAKRCVSACCGRDVMQIECSALNWPAVNT